jgi:AcrR family transcriptional regulator
MRSLGRDINPIPAEDQVASPTRTEILDAATRLIVKAGYSGCTMRAVAEEVNIKAASLYYHFASKDNIIAEILNHGIAMLLDEVKARLDALPPDTLFSQRFDAAIQSHITCMTGSGTYYMQVYEYLPPVLKRSSRTMRDKYAKLWFDLLKFGVEQGAVDPGLNLAIAVPYILGGLNRIPEWFHSAKFKQEDVAASVSAILLGGMTPIATSAAKPKRRPQRSD